MEIHQALLLLITVIIGNNSLKCYTGMTQNGVIITGVGITETNCTAAGCVTLKYSGTVGGVEANIKQTMCLPPGADCNKLCDIMKNANTNVIKECEATCCTTELCNNVVVNTPKAKSIHCYEGMTQNGSPVSGRNVTKKDCSSGECANIHYSMSMFGVSMKVNQAMCVSTGLSCTKLCETVASTNKDIKDCKAVCCRTELCNVVTKSTPVKSIQCYEGMTQNGNPVPGMPVSSKDCSSGECANIHYTMDMSGVSIKVNQAMCVSTGLTCAKLCEIVKRTNKVIKDCKAACCKTDLCNVVTKSTPAKSIQCYDGVIQNGNPVPGMPVSSKNCSSGECANIHYTVAMSGQTLKVNQAVCVSTGLTCTKLCETVTGTNKDIKDCKSFCCKTKLCNAVNKAVTSTITTPATSKPKPEIKCYVGVSYGNPWMEILNSNSVQLLSCPDTNECYSASYKIPLSKYGFNIEVPATQGFCGSKKVNSNQLCSTINSPVEIDFIKCKSLCCTGDKCNRSHFS